MTSLYEFFFLSLHKKRFLILINMANIRNKRFSSANEELAISYSVRFWLFLISDILSIQCGLFVLYQLLFDRNLRGKLSYYTITALLLINLIFQCITIPLIIHYYRLDGIWQITRPFAKISHFLNFALFATETILFAWCCIERYIIIFHYRWLKKPRRRHIFQYFPLIIISYCFIYYSLIIFYPFCEYIPYQSTINGVFIPCFLVDPILSKYDLILHQIIPLILIFTFTFLLFFRFVKRKRQFHQRNQWSKQQKLIIQVLVIFIVFCGFQFPWTVLQLCSLFGLSLNSFGNVKNYMFFFGYYVCFLLPIVCCGTLPDLRIKLKTFFCCKKY